MCPGDFYKWLPWKEPLTAAFQEHTRQAESGKQVSSGGSNDFESPCVSRGARAGGGKARTRSEEHRFLLAQFIKGLLTVLAFCSLNQDLEIRD